MSGEAGHMRLSDERVRALDAARVMTPLTLHILVETMLAEAWAEGHRDGTRSQTRGSLTLNPYVWLPSPTRRPGAQSENEMWR